MSFSTYFNAFPASYWRRWSILQSVVLRAELTGTGRVDVYRRKATGARIFIEGRPFHHDDDGPAVARVRNRPRAVRGRRLDLVRHHQRHAGHLHDAGWYAPAPAPGTANIAVGMPTFNRPDDCVDTLRALTSDPLVDKVIGAVIVPDQGRASCVTTRSSPRRPHRWEIGCRSTTSPTSAVRAATAG